MGLLLEPGDERARSLQRHLVVVHAEKQEEAVARLRAIGAH
jgi:hypothetical protein